MTAQLSGRQVRTLVTELELLSNDETLVLRFGRNEDGSIVISTRKPHEDYWTMGTQFSVGSKDARFLGLLLKSEDVSYGRAALDEIPAAHVKREKPADVLEAELREKIGDCSELDIERAKAANIAEEKELLLLQLKRDHSLDKHNPRVDGCPSCENEIHPGHGDGSLRPNQTEPDRTNENEEIDFAARRVGTGHEETPISGRSFCGDCGYVDEDRPEINRYFHGDSQPDAPDELPY